jgi:hypothetical protein
MQAFSKLVVTAALSAGTAPALAHHSFAAEFDMEQPIKLRGTVTEVEFMNPHSWIHIDVRNEDGTVEKWAIEGGTPNTLFRAMARTAPTAATSPCRTAASSSSAARRRRRRRNEHPDEHDRRIDRNQGR